MFRRGDRRELAACDQERSGLDAGRYHQAATVQQRERRLYLTADLLGGLVILEFQRPLERLAVVAETDVVSAACGVEIVRCHGTSRSFPRSTLQSPECVRFVSERREKKQERTYGFAISPLLV